MDRQNNRQGVTAWRGRAIPARVIRLEGVSKVFRTGAETLSALSDIDLHVTAGSIFGVIGRSGAGKSTLLRCVNLLERPTSGKVSVAGRELTALSEPELVQARRAIGMVFQQPQLLASRTIAQNVALPLELAGAPREEIATRVAELLALTGISDKHGARPAQLSGGQRQRATIARALANRPRVLLCDEATSALDPATKRSILALLRELQRSLELTILLITHEMDVVQSICDEVAVLSDGRLVEQGPVQKLFARAASPLFHGFGDTSRKLDVPQDYHARLGSAGNLLLRVELTELGARAPWLSQLARAVDVRVVSARLERSAGELLLELQGDAARTRDALGFLREQHIEVEVIGHVTSVD